MPQSNIEVFYTVWFAVPSQEAQNHGVLCLHGHLVPGCEHAPLVAGNLGQWSASSVLVGHNTLMKDLKILHDAGRNLRQVCFRPVDKTFYFGGDASSRSEWSIHLPVNIGGSFGRLQVFVIPGDTPFLLGRPVLKHFKIQIDYALDQISIDGNAWTSAIKGRREEYLIDLHHPGDDWSQPWNFDLMTDDTISNFTYDPDADTINLEDYLCSHSTSTSRVHLQHSGQSH